MWFCHTSSVLFLAVRLAKVSTTQTVQCHYLKSDSALQLQHNHAYYYQAVACQDHIGDYRRECIYIEIIYSCLAK